MEHELIIDSLERIDAAAEEFLEAIGETRLVAFHGSMGAGKTTFITALCRRLGVDGDAVASPTFAIVNEYRLPDGDSVFHFDFYRIEDPAEALDLGLYDYLDSGSLCLMEWPENIAALLPEETLHVTIQTLPDLRRSITWRDL